VAIFEMKHKISELVVYNGLPFEKVAGILNSLAVELNTKYMCDIGDIYVCEQQHEDTLLSDEGEESGPGANLRLIFIGGSHAARAAAAADNAGYDAINLAVPGFRVTPESVENAGILLQDEIRGTSKRVVVIYHLFNNSVFFSAMEDGSRSLPKRGMDNIYHVPGKLEFADHTVLKNLVNCAIPLLRAGGDCEKIILSPLPRYIKKCCENTSHLVNRKEKSFCGTLGEALSNMKDTIRDVVFSKKIRAFKVVSPLLLLVGEDDEENATRKFMDLFKDDPVHMPAHGYAALVDTLTKLMDTCIYTRSDNHSSPLPRAA
jgi:hypothetical protein